MKKIFLFFMLLFMFISYANAATIHGNIYDLTLTKVSNVIVEIDTTPNQRFVAINGSYSFDVPIGSYKIKTDYQEKNLRMSASENITIIDNGKFIIDLFLYPNFSDEDTLYDEFDLEFEELYDTESKFNFFIIALLVFALIIGVVLFVKSKEKVIPKNQSDIEKLLNILKSNNGRMTQKDLRKHFAMSEAKISLMITELESLKKIKKIKKGRGNIIILIAS
jgi:uncharacterized membrane protein